MLRLRFLGVAGAGALVLAALAAPSAARAAGTGAYVLTATNNGKGYAPNFTSNGRLGIRVPATGQGTAGGTVPAQAELAGFSPNPATAPKPAEGVQQRANIPTWSTLAFTD